jgi:adenosylhomocysteinase
MIKNIKPLFEKYTRLYPEEVMDLSLLAEQLGDEEDITSRKNFVGHVTASGFVINENTKQVLLLEHKTLAKLLQPGGHVESEDNTFADAVLRELEEETGLTSAELSLRSVISRDTEVPFDIDTHNIPENPKKGEPAHFHHDFRYVYTTKENNIKVDASESNGYKWVDWGDFIESPNFVHLADKISTLLEPNARDFFRSLTNEQSKNISVIAVSHIIPSSEEYLKSLQENFNLIGVIPKPKSIAESTRAVLEDEGLTILDVITRESIQQNPEVLAKLLEPYENICLVDIGGYFTDSMDYLKEKLGAKLLGVVEDTENGLQKYEQNLPTNAVFMSVARSPLKNYEDQLVGHGIAHATETVLRLANILMTYKSCGIIGYGKIGRGIAEYLQQRGIKPMVSEQRATRSVQASCDGAILATTDELIRKCDVIFCATGAHALDIVKLRNVKKGAYIASATSSDDEFNLEFVDSEYEKWVTSPHMTKYAKRGHSFHLLNDGNAINFLFAAAVDKYIHLVQGELVFSLSKLANASVVKVSGTILTNTEDDHEYIAKQWLDSVELEKVKD